MSAYKKVMNQIHASEEFKSKMQKEMMEYEKKEKRVFMKNIKLIVSFVSCAVIAVGAVFCKIKMQRIAMKNTECCHPIFLLFSRQRIG